jgi:ribosomal protein S18 acetylase RimI-like enzyme
VRAARRGDALEALALRRRVLEEGGGFISMPQELTTTVADEEALIASCTGSTGVYLVARVRPDADTPGPAMRVAGVVVARVGALLRMRHAAKLEVMVDPVHRRRGLGRALMKGCIAWAEGAAGVEKLSLNVFADNEGALALYEELGFVEEGRRTREYKDPDGRYRDDVLMRRWV